MTRLLLLVPFCYFLKTRLNTKAAILFHGYAEYLLGVLLLIYSGIGPVQAGYSFLAGYIAFISVYEIGYIVNDFVAVRYEQNPRKRLGAIQVGAIIVYSWIAVRVAVFFILTFYLDRFDSLEWWAFYSALFVSFLLHNVIRVKEYKIFTFIALAFMRFYAPVFPFLDPPFLLDTFGGILLFYVFFRTLTYIDSKGLLVIPSRASFTFKLFYYLIILPVSAVIAVLTKENLILWLNIYFLLFWSVLFLLYKAGAIPESSIKNES